MFGNTRVCVRVVATADGVHSSSLIGPLPVTAIEALLVNYNTGILMVVFLQTRIQNYDDKSICLINVCICRFCG